MKRFKALRTFIHGESYILYSNLLSDSKEIAVKDMRFRDELIIPVDNFQNLCVGFVRNGLSILPNTICPSSILPRLSPLSRKIDEQEN